MNQQDLNAAISRHRAGDFQDALKLATRCLKKAPRNMEALSVASLSAFELGKFDKTLSFASKMIQLKPDAVMAYFHRGCALFRLGRFETAASDFGQAITLAPTFSDALIFRSLVFKELGKLDDAVADLDQAILLAPENHIAFNNRALLHQKQGGLDKALDDFNSSHALNPNFPEALNNRGVLHKISGRIEDALNDFSSAIALQSTYIAALSNRGELYRQQGHLDEALADFTSLISVQPNKAEAYNERGLTLRELFRFDEALADYNKAISLNPNLVAAYANRSVVMTELRRFDKAAADCETAISLNPDFPGGHWEKALLLLRSGEFEHGWALYEWRWKRQASDLKKRVFSQPQWTGTEDLNGKTIFLHWEQGLGDTLQFCRYALELSKRGGRVILEAQNALTGVLSSLQGVDEVVPAGSFVPAFDYHCPLMSLPLAMATTLQTIPRHNSYLKADKAKVEDWAQSLGPKSRPRIGIAWSTNLNNPDHRHKSVSLQQFIDALPDNYELISLQKDVTAQEQEAIETAGNIKHYGAGFADTAAICALVDVVITVDTSLAHLAGALGRPTYVLLRFTPDFRWLLDRDDSPWYPTMTLFRQAEDRTWGPVFTAVNKALTSHFG